MNNLTEISNPFQFTDHEVRTATDEQGNPWFCAKDVFEAMGIDWKGVSGSLKNCPDDWVMVCYLQTIKGQRETIFISEPAVYQTIFRSSKPEAVKFANWVCEEVLPSIRKQGFFGSLNINQRINISNQIHKITQTIVKSKDRFQRQLMETELRTLCNIVGENIPSLEFIGQDVAQISLPLNQ